MCSVASAAESKYQGSEDDRESYCCSKDKKATDLAVRMWLAKDQRWFRAAVQVHYSQQSVSYGADNRGAEKVKTNGVIAPMSLKVERKYARPFFFLLVYFLYSTTSKNGMSYSGIIARSEKQSGRLIVVLYALRVRETRVRFSAPRLFF